MNKKPICQNCKNWELTKPEIRYGFCHLFKKQTEWCAGIRVETPLKRIVCPGFEEK